MAIIQGSSYNLQGASPSLQGNTLNLQGSSPTVKTPTVQSPAVSKKIVYGNTAATSPAKQQFISTLAQDNNPQSTASANEAYFNANPNVFGGSQTSNFTPQAPTPLDSAKSTYLDSLKSALTNLQTAQSNQGTLTPEALQAQQDLTNFKGQEQQGLTALTGQGRGIPLQLVRGQQGKLLQQGQIQEQTLQNNFSNLQNQSIAKRAGDVAAAQTALGLYTQAPTSVSVGSNLVKFNPTTGQYDTVAEGQSYAGKQGQQAVFTLYKTYPDAGIDPINDDYATAQAKAAASQSFTNKSSQVQTIANPLTGAISVIPTKPYSSSNAASVQNYNNQTPQFTLASDGRTVLANGTPVDLNTFRQLTGQTGATTDFSMVGKTNQSINGARSSGGTIQTNPNDVYNLDLAKGLASANSTIIGQTAQASSGLTAFSENAATLQNYAKQYGINLSSYPNINSLAQAFQKKGLDSKVSAGIIAAYNNGVENLRADYSQILEAKGTLTPSAVSGKVDDLIPHNLSPADMQYVINRVQQEAQANISGQQKTMDTIRSNVTSIPFNTGTAAPTPNFNSTVQSTPVSLFNGLF